MFDLVYVSKYFILLCFHLLFWLNYLYLFACMQFWAVSSSAKCILTLFCFVYFGMIYVLYPIWASCWTKTIRYVMLIVIILHLPIYHPAGRSSLIFMWMIILATVIIRILNWIMDVMILGIALMWYMVTIFCFEGV